VLLPVTTRMATAAIGRASLRKAFQIPVNKVDRVIAERLNPQERSIAKATPTAMTPPPGTVLAIEVVVWLLTAAWPRVSPGSEAISWAQ